MRLAGLSLRMLARDWRAGELRILAAALVVAVAGITSVGFFTDRIRLALERQATELLGGDLVVSADHAMDELASGGGPPGLRRARTVAFPSMVIADGGSRLAAVKAASEAYPLRGRLRIAPELFAPDAPADGVPAPGTVWVESRLLGQLGVRVGDALTLGEARFEIAAVLTSEPARAGGSLFNIAPRVLMSLEDVGRTGLVGPTSRVHYHYLFAGTPQVVEQWRARLQPRLGRGERLQGVEDARPEIRSALDRSRRFLGLAALTSVLLAGVAVALATRRFMARHIDNCAMMRCLGARQSVILRLYVYQMVWLGVGAALTGCALGYLAQFGLERILASVAQVELPAPSMRPVFLGLLAALATQLGFALPTLLQLRDIPALRVLRGELGAVPGAGWIVYLGGVGAIAALVFWQAGDATLAGYVLLGMAGTLLALAGLGAVLIRILRASRHRLGPIWRFGVLSITQRAGTGVLQVMAFGLGITALLLLTVVRGDLLRDWEQSLPPEAPNRFLINIQPDQLEALRGFFRERGIQVPGLFPMVRGRLAAIDGRPVSPEDYEDDRAQRLAGREFNLSWARRLQGDNRIVAGRWWTPEEHGERVVSVEEGLAETLGIALGDELTFRVAGREVTVEVTSLREVEWDSFRVNFFVIAPPGVLESFPASYITALYVPPERHRVLNALVMEFPNITVIDVAAIMQQVRRIMERVALAVEYVFLFTVLSGLLVMYAAIYSTLDERIRESVLLRTLGADRRRLQRALAVEFTVLGLLSGLVGAFAAGLLADQLAGRVFQLDYGPDPWLWLVGAAAGAAGVGLAGVLATRFVLRIPPLRALREAL